MIAKPLRDITEADLRALVETRAHESRTLEFKSALPGPADGDKVKFLKEVTAFANTVGGDLVYGILEEDLMAIELAPLAPASRDIVQQRLESLCRDGVEPRLVGVDFHWVAIASGGCALVVRAPRSWQAPHRITTGGSNAFYGRSTVDAYPLDVGDLRRAFGLAGDAANRMRAFRAERVALLGSRNGPIELRAGALAVLHLLPLQAFISDAQIDVTASGGALNQFHPLGSRGFNDRLNLDGRLTFRGDGVGGAFGYTQLFRTAIVEAVDVQPGEQRFLGIDGLELDIIQGVGSYFPALQQLGVQTPAYLLLSLLGVKQFQLSSARVRSRGDPGFVADRDVMHFPEVLIAEWSSDPQTVLRPLFDTVWNAFGYAQSFNYNDAGRWRGS